MPQVVVEEGARPCVLTFSPGTIRGKVLDAGWRVRMPLADPAEQLMELDFTRLHARLAVVEVAGQCCKPFWVPVRHNVEDVLCV